MKATRLILITALAILASACEKAPEPTPAEKAIGNHVRNETKVPIHIESAKKIDSTTYAKELSRRIGIYQLRIMQNSQRAEKYAKQKMPKNTRIMREAIVKDHKIIAGLDSIRNHMGRDTLEIAYYDYEFEYCTADEKGNKTKPKKAYATVTPTNKVITWSLKRRDIHKAAGLSIPGYRKLLDELKTQEQE